MRSVTSCFDLTLYKKDLARFWPLWVLYTVVWIFLLPLSLISYNTYVFNRADLLQWVGRNPVQIVGGGGGLFLAVVYGVMLAVAAWSYLYNHRSANMMHTLPVRREGHFITHYCAGVTMFVLPHVIVFLVMLLTECLCGAVNVGALAAALGCQTLMCLFYFSFATACAMLTGHILVLPVFYGIFNFLIVVLSALTDWLGTFFFYGYTGGLVDTPAVRWLTPVVGMAERFGYEYPTQETVMASGETLVERIGDVPFFRGVSALVIYAAVGLLMAVIALLLYRKRHMETASDVVAVLCLRPVFLYCVALCTGLAGGCFTCGIFGTESLPYLILGLLVWGTIGYFAALMLLNKSFRVFRKGWKGCLITAVVLLALCGAMHLDLFGVESRVPTVENVAQVRVSGIDSYPSDDAAYTSSRKVTDPEAIAKIIDVHQTIVDQKEQREADERNYDLLRGYDDYDRKVDGQTARVYLNIVYTLKDGSKLERDYNWIWLLQSNLKDPTSLEAQITDMINDRTLLADRYAMNTLKNAELTGAEIGDSGTRVLSAFYVDEGDFHFEAPYYWDQAAYEEYVDKMGESTSTIAEPVFEKKGTLVETQITEAQAERLRQAVLADFEAGRLGVRYLFNDDPERQENTCVGDLTLHYEHKVTESDNEYFTVSETTITLTPQAEETIAALTDMEAFTTGGAELRTNSGTLLIP